jgi:hypothetical protein
VSRLLVDTRALLWWLTDDPALSQTARDALGDAVNEPLVSAGMRMGDRHQAIARKAHGTGRPTRPDRRRGLLMAADQSHARLAGPRPARASRRSVRPLALVAQALTERLPIVTADVRFGDYGVDVRW